MTAARLKLLECAFVVSMIAFWVVYLVGYFMGRLP